MSADGRDRQDGDVDGDLDELLALETEVWRALVAGDPGADGAHLADDFVGLYPTGFADRSDHVGQLEGGPTVASFALDQVRLVPVAEAAALLCYRASFRRPGAPASGPAEVMYVSSLWCRRDGRWVNTFSQDTPASVAPVP
jgi:hypothetical protein